MVISDGGFMINKVLPDFQEFLTSRVEESSISNASSNLASMILPEHLREELNKHV